MRYTKQMRRDALLARLASLGINSIGAARLLKAERALQRWAEAECGNSNDWASWHIERDETSGKPLCVTIPHRGNVTTKHPVRDMERAALRWAAEVCEPLGLVWFHQGDPRGCALYVGRKEDLGGLPVEQAYTRLVGVCY